MKNRFVAAALAFFLGGFGVHKFYLGKWNGLFYLILCWTYVPVIIALIEGVLYLVNGEDEFNRKYNKSQWKQHSSCYYQPSQPEVHDKYILPESETTMSKVCPQCGKRNELDSNFCESCGKKL